MSLTQISTFPQDQDHLFTLPLSFIHKNLFFLRFIRMCLTSQQLEALVRAPAKRIFKCCHLTFKNCNKQTDEQT